eukprot:3880765-Heterocapsa_arctica.AAC.1
MADMQTGVRKEEPAAPTKGWRKNWAEQCSNKAIAEELEEDVEEGSDSGDINVLCDSVAYAQKHILLNDNDWINPDTGYFLSNMPICELMTIRRVKTAW